MFLDFVTLFHLLLTWIDFCNKLKEKSQHLLIFAIMFEIFVYFGN